MIANSRSAKHLPIADDNSISKGSLDRIKALNARSGDAVKKRQALIPKKDFIVMCLLTFVFSIVPIISSPLDWMMVFFHELSHCLASLMTGGEVIVVKLDMNTSGYCITDGGNLIFTYWAGYSGSVLWGAILFLGATLKGKDGSILVAFLLFVLICVALLWVRDEETLFILAIIYMLLTVSLLGQIKRLNFIKFQRCMQFIGLYIILSGFRGSFYTLQDGAGGDAANLATLTYLPPGFWFSLWGLFSFGGLYFLWYASISRPWVGGRRRLNRLGV